MGSKLQVLQFTGVLPNLLRALQFIVGSPHQPSQFIAAACVEDGEWVLMEGRTISCYLHFHTLVQVHIVPGEDILAAGRTVFNGFFFLLSSSLTHALPPHDIVPAAVRKDPLPHNIIKKNKNYHHTRSTLNQTLSSPRCTSWSHLTRDGLNNEWSALWSMGVIGHRFQEPDGGADGSHCCRRRCIPAFL